MTTASPQPINPDGTIDFRSDQSMGSNKLTDLAAPSSANDAARKTDVDNVAVGTTNLADESVTLAKLAHVATNTLLGRVTASTGDVEALTSGSFTEEGAPTTGHFLIGFVSGALRVFDVGNLPTGGGGEANTASNLGAGTGVFEGKSGVDLQFNSLVGANGITVSEDDPNDEIDIAVDLATDPGLEFSTGSLRVLVDPAGALERVTAGLDVKDNGLDNARLAQAAGYTLKGNPTGSTANVQDFDLSSLVAETTPASGDLFLIEKSTGELQYVDFDNMPGASGGETNTASNLGTGAGVFEGKSGVDLQFNSLVGADGISISEDDPNDEIDIAVDLSATPGLEFSSGALQVLVDPSGSLEVVAAGLDVKDAGIDTARLQNNSVTVGKLQQVATGTLLGRYSTSTGNVESFTLGDLTAEATPGSGDFFLLQLAAGGLRKVDFDDMPGATAGEVNTASNLGAGVGVFEGKSGVDLQFNSLVGADGISISEDDPNDEIDIAVDLSATPGLEFSSGALQVLVDPSGALEVVAAGVDVQDAGIDTARLADEAVTLAKVQHVATSTLLGRHTAATGDVESFSVSALTAEASPASGDLFLLEKSGGGLRKVDFDNLPGGSGDLNAGSSSQLQISAGAVTKTGSYHTIASESAGTADDLETINGGTEGDMLWIQEDSEMEAITVKHNVGNILTSTAADVSLDIDIPHLLFFNGTNWTLRV